MSGGSGFEFYGNVGALDGLSADQQNYLNRFKGIMEAVNSQAQQTLRQWEGSGNPGFTKAAADYHSHFTAVNGAFAKLIASTDSASQRTAQLTHYLDGLF